MQIDLPLRPVETNELKRPASAITAPTLAQETNARFAYDNEASSGEYMPTMQTKSEKPFYKKPKFWLATAAIAAAAVVVNSFVNRDEDKPEPSRTSGY